MPQKFKHVSLMLLLGLGAFVTSVKAYQNGAPSYPLLSCERLKLRHDTQPIIGAEDMAYDAQSGYIYISAYDRREKIAGGIYRFHIETPQRLEKVQSIAVDYPHGLSLARSGDALSLSLIARDLSDPKVMAASIRSFVSRQGAPFQEVEPAITDASLCAANNLIALPELVAEQTGPSKTGLNYLVTQDHQTCGLSQQRRENIFSPNSGSLTYFGRPENMSENMSENTVENMSDVPVHSPAIKNLSFANGIVTNGRDIFVAETRAKHISLYHNIDAPVLSHSIELAGGPDNLTLSETGDIIAALHPSLIGFAAYRAGWGPRVKSRLSIISPDQSLTTYDVPPDILSGATVALAIGDDIYLGAAYDEGIARCRLPLTAARTALESSPSARKSAK